MLKLIRLGRTPVDAIPEMFVMAAKEELIRHACNVIADDDVARLGLRKVFVGRWHRAGRAEVVHEEFLEAAHGAVAIFGDGRVIVNVCEQEALESGVTSRCRMAEAGEALGGVANIVQGRSVGGKHPLLGGFDQVRGQGIEDVLQDFIEL